RAARRPVRRRACLPVRAARQGRRDGGRPHRPGAVRGPLLRDRGGPRPLAGRRRRAGGGGRGEARRRSARGCRSRVSWELGSTALVTLALAAGIVWYERRRPPSRLVALGAALAALAIAAGVLFTPTPNVRGTTDVVLLAGYALGPLPGFVVGAVAALVSNFFLGQGP